MDQRRQDEVPELWIEQLRLGELSPERAQEVRRRLGPAVETRLAALEADDRRILERHPPGRLVAALDTAARDTHQARQRRRALGVALALGAAAAAILLWLPGQRAADPGVAAEPEPTLEATRIKGIEPGLRIYRQTGDRPVRLGERERVRAGDVLQVSYLAAGQAHGVIYSEDGAGRVTLHHPERAGGSTALVPDGEVPLRHAFELDDAPAFERFVFVTSEAPLDVDQVVRLIRETDPPEPTDTASALPPGWRFTAITLTKGDR